MIAKAVVLTVLVLFALGAPWVVGSSFGAPIPAYLEDGWVGFACLTSVSPGGSPTPVLLQLSFDKLAGGGIALGRADSLFERHTSSFGWLSQLIGASFQVTCTHTPSQIQTTYPGLTARQAAQDLSASFQARGFSAYLILDSFLSIAPSYLDAAILVLRTDAFRVVGPNDLSYLGGNDAAESPTP
jgi:hypothetical protein